MEAPRARLLCIVIPCFDEAEVLGHTYAELKRVLSGMAGYRHLIYFVDDGSRDGTLHEMNRLARRDESVRVLSLSRNFGHQVAIIAGIEHAERRADALLVMDADLENPPALIPEMLAQLESGYDVVLGVRRSERRVGLLRRLASRAFYRLFNQLADVPITPDAPDFFLLSPRAREALERMAERRPFLRAMVAWIGFAAARVSYVPPARARGRSKYTPSRMLRLAEDALFAFSSKPARLLLRSGALGALLGLSLLAGVALRGVEGSTALAALAAGIALAVSGVQLAALGLVAGYLVRALEQSRGRPLYFLQQLPDEPRAGDAKLVEMVSRGPVEAQRRRA
jgi:glycosyltransferase involved in cell wall biosynthesis